MPKTATTTISTEHVLTLNKHELLEALRDGGCSIPANCEITVRVPGGGDWSNTNLDISANSPICITWKTEKRDA